MAEPRRLADREAKKTGLQLELLGTKKRPDLSVAGFLSISQKDHLQKSQSRAITSAIEYPAALDRTTTRNAIEAKIKATGPSEGMKAELEKIQQLEANTGIGKVVVASGHYKNASNRRMDRALMESPSTHPKNKPSSTTHLRSNGDFPDGDQTAYTLNKDSFARNIGAIRANSWAAKKGRTSNVTAGIVNNTRPSRSLGASTENLWSQEVEVMGLAPDFAPRGGGISGRFITNASGKIAGVC